MGDFYAAWWQAKLQLLYRELFLATIAFFNHKFGSSLGLSRVATILGADRGSNRILERLVRNTSFRPQNSGDVQKIPAFIAAGTTRQALMRLDGERLKP